MEDDPDVSVDALVARLCEDEAWQSNLDDPERALFLAWAREELIEAMRQRFTVVRGWLKTMNGLLPAGDGWIDRESAIRAILKLDRVG